MRFLLFLLLPCSLLAQPNRFDAVLKKHPMFNGVVLLAGKGQIQWEQAYGYRTYADKVPLQKTQSLLEWRWCWRSERIYEEIQLTPMSLNLY